VLSGVEKMNHRRLKYMYPCTKNFGIVLNERRKAAREDPRFTNPITNKEMAAVLTWPILKGDLILSDEPRVVPKECHFEFRENQERKFKFPIYEYEYDDEVPTSFKYSNGKYNSLPNSISGNETSTTNPHKFIDLTEVFTLNCDLSKYPIDDFDRYDNGGRPYYVASLICRLSVSRTTFTAEMLWNGNVVSSQKKDFESRSRG
jgi:hypothetical protein